MRLKWHCDDAARCCPCLTVEALQLDAPETGAQLLVPGMHNGDDQNRKSVPIWSCEVRLCFAALVFGPLGCGVIRKSRGKHPFCKKSVKMLQMDWAFSTHSTNLRI